MTIAELADYVCSKVNQTDDSSVAACRNYLKRRMEIIWNQELWRDSLRVFDYNWDHDDGDINAAGIAMMPFSVDKVIAVRNSDGEIPKEEVEHWFRLSTNYLNEVGDPVRFHTLSPVVFETRKRWTGTQNELSAESLVIDTSVTSILTIKYRLANGILKTGTATSTTNEHLLTWLADEDVYSIESLSLDTTGSKFYGFWNLATAAVAARNESNAYILFPVGIPSSARKRVRLQLVEIPDSDLTLTILGKCKMESFQDDGDSPPLSGCENCLIAFAQADMYERKRHLAKAQQKFQEAATLLDQLRMVETFQAAYRPRLIPEDGAGSCYRYPTKAEW